MWQRILFAPVGKLLAKSKPLQEAFFAALAAGVEPFLRRTSLAEPSRFFKEHLFRRLNATTLLREAEALKRMAEAEEAACKVKRPEHEEEPCRLQRERLMVENSKLRAELQLSQAKAKRARSRAIKRRGKQR